MTLQANSVVAGNQEDRKVIFISADGHAGAGATREAKVVGRGWTVIQTDHFTTFAPLALIIRVHPVHPWFHPV